MWREEPSVPSGHGPQRVRVTAGMGVWGWGGGGGGAARGSRVGLDRRRVVREADAVVGGDERVGPLRQVGRLVAVALGGARLLAAARAPLVPGPLALARGGVEEVVAAEGGRVRALPAARRGFHDRSRLRLRLRLRLQQLPTSLTSQDSQKVLRCKRQNMKA